MDHLRRSLGRSCHTLGTGAESPEAQSIKRPRLPSDEGAGAAKRRAKEGKKHAAKQQQATSETVAAIVALNAKLAKKMSLNPAASAGSGMGRSKRASTAACSRATAQADLLRQLQ